MKKALPFIIIFLSIGLGATAFVAIRSIQESDIEPSVVSQPGPEVVQELAPETAIYNVTFNATWSEETHPDRLPGNAHMSPGVLVRHSPDMSLFTIGEPATEGLQEVAETGRTATIAEELDALGLTYQLGSRIDVPADGVFEVELTQADSAVSFVTMLAPSPDWFIALESLNLFEFGQWTDSFIDVPLVAYDAGTDSGQTFTAANSVTSPQDVVSSPIDEQFLEASAVSFGSLTIQRTDVQ